jgi:hypothetical protein
MKQSLVFASASLALVGSTMAQQAVKPLDPPELIAKRADHLRAIQRATIQPLSTYVRELESLQGFYSRAGKAEAAAAVAAEIVTVKEQLATAQSASNITTGSPVQLQIDLVQFGDIERNRVIDVTKYVQDGFSSGRSSISIRGTDMVGARDPAPGVHKNIKILYTVNGKRKEKVFKDGPDAVLDFKKDLK